MNKISEICFKQIQWWGERGEVFEGTDESRWPCVVQLNTYTHYFICQFTDDNNETLITVEENGSESIK